MRPRYLLAMPLLVVGLALATCAPRSGNDEPQPPEIAYGQDTCDACGMIIDEPRFAGALLLESGDTLKFDDIGDMFIYHMDHPDRRVRAWFVHDFNTEQWTRGETAYYIFSRSIASPMGHGFAAFADRAPAEAFAAGLGASVLNFDLARATAHVEIHR